MPRGERVVVLCLLIAVAGCGEPDERTAEEACLDYHAALERYSVACVGSDVTGRSGCQFYAGETTPQSVAHFACLEEAIDAAIDDCSIREIDCEGASRTTDPLDDCESSGSAAACHPSMDLDGLAAILGAPREAIVVVEVGGDDFLDPEVYSSYAQVSIQDANSVLLADCTTQIHDGARDSFCMDVGGASGADIDQVQILEVGNRIEMEFNDLDPDAALPLQVEVTTGWSESQFAPLANDSGYISVSFRP